MKVGVRKPSIKKSISARTTGRAKRAIKSSVNPLYGKKGMGFVNNPKKAVYNKIYSKTSFSAFKGASNGIAALFMFFFYIMWMMIKWSYIAIFYMCKWLFYSIPVWLYQTIKQLIKDYNSNKEVNEFDEKDADTHFEDFEFDED